MTRAAIYARVSTDDQDGEDRTSLDEQMLACATFAESKGWEVVNTFSDVESGTSRKRPGFKALQGAAVSGEIDMIVVWKSDRLFRELGPAADLADAITPNGVGLQSVTDIIDPVTLGLMAGIASMERKAFLRPNPGWENRERLVRASFRAPNPHSDTAGALTEGRSFTNPKRRSSDGSSMNLLKGRG